MSASSDGVEPLVEAPGRLQGRQPKRLRGDVAVGGALADSLEGGERPAELFAGRDVLSGGGQRPFAHPELHRAAGHQHPLGQPRECGPVADAIVGADVDVEGQVGRRLAVGRVDGVDRHAVAGRCRRRTAPPPRPPMRRPPRARRAGRTGRLASTRRGDSRPRSRLALTDGSAIVLAPGSASALVSTISPAAAPATIAAPRSPANSARASAVTTDGTSGTDATVRPCWVAIRLSATIPMPLPPARSGSGTASRPASASSRHRSRSKPPAASTAFTRSVVARSAKSLRGEVADDLLLVGEVEVHTRPPGARDEVADANGSLRSPSA